MRSANYLQPDIIASVDDNIRPIIASCPQGHRAHLKITITLTILGSRDNSLYIKSEVPL